MLNAPGQFIHHGEAQTSSNTVSNRCSTNSNACHVTASKPSLTLCLLSNFYCRQIAHVVSTVDYAWFYEVFANVLSVINIKSLPSSFVPVNFRNGVVLAYYKTQLYGAKMSVLQIPRRTCG